MEKTIEHDPWEVSFSMCVNWDVWAFPVQIAWWRSKDIQGSNNKSVTLQILCFTFHIDVWKWSEKGKENETTKS